jgi:hypothetical protein
MSHDDCVRVGSVSGSPSRLDFFSLDAKSPVFSPTSNDKAAARKDISRWHASGEEVARMRRKNKHNNGKKTVLRLPALTHSPPHSHLATRIGVVWTSNQIERLRKSHLFYEFARCMVRRLTARESSAAKKVCVNISGFVAEGL